LASAQRSAATSAADEPVFYFPSWEVRCDGAPVATYPAPATGLLAYKGEGCMRQLVLTAPERYGMALSLSGLLALLAIGLGWDERLRPSTLRQRKAPLG
jgi:hypothetical protein